MLREHRGEYVTQDEQRRLPRGRDITELSGSHVSGSGGEEKGREFPAEKTISKDTRARNIMRWGGNYSWM